MSARPLPCNEHEVRCLECDGLVFDEYGWCSATCERDYWLAEYEAAARAWDDEYEETEHVRRQLAAALEGRKQAFRRGWNECLESVLAGIIPEPMEVE